MQERHRRHAERLSARSQRDIEIFGGPGDRERIKRTRSPRWCAQELRYPQLASAAVTVEHVPISPSIGSAQD
jgi:hypothetical protein